MDKNGLPYKGYYRNPLFYTVKSEEKEECKEEKRKERFKREYGKRIKRYVLRFFQS